MQILKTLKKIYFVYTDIVMKILVLFLSVSFTCFWIKGGYNLAKSLLGNKTVAVVNHHKIDKEIDK